MDGDMESEAILKDSHGVASENNPTPHHNTVNELIDADNEGARLSEGCSFFKLGVLGINGMFFAAGSAMVSLAIVVKSLTWGLLDLCQGCKQLSTAALVLGILTALFAVMGCMVSRKRSASLLLCYLCFLMVVSAGILGLATTVLVLDTQDYGIDNNWLHMIRNPDTWDELCHVQDQFSCSGWTECCDLNGTIPAEGCVWDPDQCVPDCVSDSLQPCRHAVDTSLHRITIPFTGAMGVSIAFILTGFYCLVKLKKRPLVIGEDYLELEAE